MLDADFQAVTPVHAEEYKCIAEARNTKIWFSFFLMNEFFSFAAALPTLNK